MNCPGCYSKNIHAFYECRNVPVYSVMLMRTREQALDCPKGDITLFLCHDCGFIFNASFNPNLVEYSSDYESTQTYSSTFNVFHNNLVKHLIKRYDLHDKHIIEIGCGEGEFLSLLCEGGNNRGTGYDPAYKGESDKQYGKSLPTVQGNTKQSLTFIKDYYSADTPKQNVDFIICKMTLEHIYDVNVFLKNIHDSLEGQDNVIVFFQVPSVERILKEFAFWDIYYEHCSYFSLSSLQGLFERAGFQTLDLWKGYDDQYCMIETRLTPVLHNTFSTTTLSNLTSRSFFRVDNIDCLKQFVDAFSSRFNEKVNYWKQIVESAHKENKRIVLWGGGSKGVAFLTTLNITKEIEYVVDVNPHKQQMYMPLSGHEIIAPDFLKDYKPDMVIAVNAIYKKEIQKELVRMGLSSTLYVL